MQEKMKLILVVLVAGFVSALLGLGMFIAKGKIDEQKVLLVAAQKKLAEEDAKLAKVPALKKQVTELTDTVERYEQILPNSRELASIVDFFNDAKDAASIPSLTSSVVKQKTSRRKRGAAKPTYEKHQFEVSFASSFEQMVTFINHLETSPRFFHVEKFKIETDKKTGLLHSDITLTTYRFNPQTSGSRSSKSSRSSLRR